MKTAFITGITGQDGSYLAEFLLKKDYKVVGMYRRSSVNTFERINGFTNHENLFLVEGDITDSHSIFNLISTYKPDECYNLCAQSHVHTSFEQPIYTTQVNYLGVVHLLEAVKRHSPSTKLLHCSTSEMFGSQYDMDADGTKYQSEQTRFEANSPYTCSKIASHYLMKIYKDSYGLFICTPLMFNHESARRGENFVTRKITKYIAQLNKLLNRPVLKRRYKDDRIVRYDEEKLVVDGTAVFPKLRLGNIDAVRDWSHAKDMIRGMWMMLQQPNPKDYVLCSGVGRTVREFLTEAFKCIGITNWEKCVFIDPVFFRPCEVEFLQGRYDLAKAELGWNPEYTFEELVKEMVESDIKN